jgi:hypothetical protein
MKLQSRTLTKKPYQKPQLLVYGNLTEMTRGAGMAGQMDGGGASGKTG